MKTRLTTRGKTVLAVASIAFVLGWGFGGRNLNVIVVPAVALVAVTGVYVMRFEEPTIVRHAPTHGQQGETKRLDLFVESDIGYPARVVDRVSEGIDGGRTHSIVTDGRWIRDDLGFETRGRHTIGPTLITASDPLGIWERIFTDPTTQTVTVYPQIRPLDGDGRLLREFIGVTDERDRFDTVREYRPGDPLRDINWKASAKRPGDLVVTEYAGEGAVTRVTIVAESVGPATDTVAEAAASVASYLLEAGLAVGLRTPRGHVEPGYGDSHRREMLELLALLEQGEVRADHRQAADILIQSPRNAHHVEVSMAGDHHSYSALQREESEEVSA